MNWDINVMLSFTNIGIFKQKFFETGSYYIANAGLEFAM
jgi:hypothetical protein